jgi:Chitin binding Peritrophin-A domain
MKCLLLIISTACIVAPSVAQIQNRCQNAPNGQTLPDLNQCEFFAVCSNRIENRMQCPVGRWFDYIANMCLPQETARCYVRDNNNNNDNNRLCPSLGLSTLAHQSSCSKYVVCLNGQAIQRECFAGLHWNSVAQQCMSPDQAQCTVADVPRCPSFVQNNTLNFLPSQNSCSKFFVCFNGEPLPRECAAGLHWDPMMDSCIPANMSSCVVSTR